MMVPKAYHLIAAALTAAALYGIQKDNATVVAISSILLFWASSGVVEGWKWRTASGKSDDNPIINTANYHTHRLYTNMSVCFLIISAVGFFNGIGVYLLGNIIYEMLISYVEHGKLLVQRPPFHIFGRVYARPKPLIFYLVIATISTTLFFI